MKTLLGRSPAGLCLAQQRAPQQQQRAQRAARPLARRRHTPTTAVATSLAETSAATLDRISSYNATMKRKMNWGERSPYEYHPDRGLYYSFILEDLIVGSQPRSPQDIDHIAESLGCTAILNLQQDKDLAYWGVDINALRARCEQHGVQLLRCPARDFDPHSLRATLPASVRVLDEALRRGRVYVHCTAGLGRAPAVAIAWLYWCGGMQLDEAYSYLTEVRPCGPKRDAVRGATYDLLSGRPREHFEYEAPHGWSMLSAADREALRAKVMATEVPLA